MTTDGGFSCTTCGGECSVETGRRGAPQIKCHDCGAQFDVILAPLPRAKWTLVGPSGKLASFSSAEALRDAVERTVEFGTSESQALQLPNPPSSEDLIVATPAPAPAPTPPPEPSASAALAAIEVPARVLPLTEQEDGEEEEEMRVETKEIVVVDLLSTTPTAPFEKKPSLLVTKSDRPPDSEDELEPVSLTDVLEITKAPTPGPAPEIKRSLPPAVAARASQTPPPKPSAAPKPHSSQKLELDVQSEPRVPAAKPAPKPMPERPRPVRPMPLPFPQEEEPRPPALESEPPKRSNPPSVRPSALASLDANKGSSKGWVVAVGLVAVVAAVAAYARYGSTSDGTQPVASATNTASQATPNTAPTPTPTPTPTPVETNVAMPSASVPVIASGMPLGSGVPILHRVDESKLPVNEILHRAHESMAAHDYAKAKDRFTLALAQAPGNAEAYAGLGEIARGSGDVAGAKDNYAKALQTSPHYLPAELALADLRWDSGEKAEAQKTYAAIVDRLGAGAPERARTRAGGGAPAPAPSPAPTASQPAP